MNVEELINELKKYPYETEVLMDIGGEYGQIYIDEVVFEGEKVLVK